MISLVRAAWQEELRTPMFVGLSTDGFPAKTEPAMKNGARCYHMNTAKEYEYSAEDEQWYEVPQSGGGGGGLPPVTGSGKALVSVNGQWKEQSGFPYDEGETVTTLFDETFSDFERGMEEETNYIYPIDNSDVGNENNVVIDGVTYYYVDNNAYDYTNIESCSVKDESWNWGYPSSLEFIQSGAVKKVAIPYSIEQYDPETGEPTDPLTGTLYGVYAPTDGAQDADGNTFPAAGFYCTVNGDLSESYVGVYLIFISYNALSNEWVSEHPIDEPLPDYEAGKNYRVYLDGEIAEGGSFSGSIDFNDGYVYTEDDGDGGYKAVCYLYSTSYETAPDSIEVKLEEVASGVHKLDAKYINGQTLPDASQLDNGTAMIAVDGAWVKQNGYGYDYFGEDIAFDGDVAVSDYDGFRVDFSDTFGMNVGETRYRIEFNGESYLSEVAQEGYNDIRCYFDDDAPFSELIDNGVLYFRDEREPGEVLSLTIYRVDTFKEKIDGKFIPWDENPNGLPDASYLDDGTYTLKANVEAGELWFEWVQGGDSGVVVTAENNTTVNNYQVPELTAEQVQTVYNAVATGKSVTIIDATETMMFSGINADVVSDEIFISFRYFDKMILEYDENGTINYTTIVSATEVQNMIDAAISDAIGGSY